MSTTHTALAYVTWQIKSWGSPALLLWSKHFQKKCELAERISSGPLVIVALSSELDRYRNNTSINKVSTEL